MRSRYADRLVAALWFTLTGGVTGGGVVLYDLVRPLRNTRVEMGFLLFLYVVVPGLLAGVSGFFIGAGILNPSRVTGARQAGVRGLLVSGAAWLVFAVIMASVSARGSSASLSYMLFLVLVFGSVTVGWVVAAAGVATGLLLYRYRESRGEP
jgi:hypothetical protein